MIFEPLDHVELKYFKEGGIFLGYSKDDDTIAYVEFVDFITTVRVDWLRKM